MHYAGVRLSCELRRHLVLACHLPHKLSAVTSGKYAGWIFCCFFVQDALDLHASTAVRREILGKGNENLLN